MPYRMTPSVRHRAIEVHYYYYYYYYFLLAHPGRFIKVKLELRSVSRSDEYGLNSYSGVTSD